mmetsp:Transcript_26653/g.80481  ORF Transcript_26653/g.80481 Transcript_26653/m.80481 type:complete len:172 (-) Transcript_26653:13-528(-)
MTDSHFRVPRSKEPRIADVAMATANGKFVKMPHFKSTAFLSGGSGLFCTARDFLRFCDLHLKLGVLEGRRVLSEEACLLMRENHVHDGLLKVHTMLPRGHGYGLGFGLAKGEKHRSDGTLYWSGVVGPSFWIDPTNRTAGVVFLQKYGSDPLPRVVEKYVGQGALALPHRC